MEALRSHWYETAEQVLGVAAHDQGRAGLRALLSLTPTQLETLLTQLRRIVGEPAADRLCAPAAPRSLGLLVPPKTAPTAGTEDSRR